MEAERDLADVKSKNPNSTRDYVCGRCGETISQTTHRGVERHWADHTSELDRAVNDLRKQLSDNGLEPVVVQFPQGTEAASGLDGENDDG